MKQTFSWNEISAALRVELEYSIPIFPEDIASFLDNLRSELKRSALKGQKKGKRV